MGVYFISEDCMIEIGVGRLTRYVRRVFVDPLHLSDIQTLHELPAQTHTHTHSPLTSSKSQFNNFLA